MNIAERLKNAYENVAYSGDNTWTNDSFSYQKANLELYTREQQLGLLKYSQLRPRDVKECIPKSKLAQYDNYQYDEARELSYNANITRYFTPLRLSEEFQQEGQTEPWMLPEIDDLYVWFLNFHNSEEEGDLTDEQSLKFESPLLRARFFEENVLRFFVTSDRIKHIWDVNIVVREFNEKTITIYRSPFGNYYAPQEPHTREQFNQMYNWINYMLPEQNSDVETIKTLAQSFAEQNCPTVSKEQPSKTAKAKELPATNPTKNENEPERRLYSAVLQGLSPKLSTSKNVNEQMTLLTKKNEDKKGFVHQDVALTKKKISNITKLGPLKCLEESQVVSNPAMKKMFQDNDGETSCILTSSFNKLTTTKTKLSEDLCGSSQYLNTHTTFMSNTNFFQAATSVANPVITNTFTTTSSPLTHTPSYVNNYTNYQFSSHFSNSSFHQTNNCLYSNNTYCNVSQVVANRSLHSYSRNYIPSTYHLYPPSLFMLQQNRTSTIYPQMNTSAFIHQTQQQTHFYNHPASLPRSSQNLQTSNYVRYTLPIQRSSFSPPMPHHFIQPPTTAVNWMVQNQQQPQIQNTQQSQHFVDNQNGTRLKSNKNKKLVHPPLLSPPLKSKGRSPSGSVGSLETIETSVSQKKPRLMDEPSSAKEKNKPMTKPVKDDFEEVVSKTVGVVLEEKFVPIGVSVSEVLELEALEQYRESNANDKVYQELERQAAEQYDDCPENWIRPPNCNIFGGVHCLSATAELELELHTITLITSPF